MEGRAFTTCHPARGTRERHTARHRTRRTVGPQLAEPGHTEDRVLQIQRRADDVAVSMLACVVGVEPQLVVIADSGRPALPVAAVYLTRGDRNDGADLLRRLRIDETGFSLLGHRSSPHFISPCSHWAAISAPPPSVDSTRARSECR